MSSLAGCPPFPRDSSSHGFVPSLGIGSFIVISRCPCCVGAPVGMEVLYCVHIYIYIYLFLCSLHWYLFSLQIYIYIYGYILWNPKFLGLILEDLTKIDVFQVNLPPTEERSLGFSVYIHLLHVFTYVFLYHKILTQAYPQVTT